MVFATDHDFHIFRIRLQFYLAMSRFRFTLLLQRGIKKCWRMHGESLPDQQRGFLWIEGEGFCFSSHSIPISLLNNYSFYPYFISHYRSRHFAPLPLSYLFTFALVDCLQHAHTHRHIHIHRVLVFLFCGVCNLVVFCTVFFS